MPSKQDEHFDEYTAQTEAKHQILNGYLRPYFTALKNRADRFHYIDGFAGKGQYGGKYDGSPILALKTLESAGVIGRSTISLVENDEQNFLDLQEAIASSPLSRQLAVLPTMMRGEFTNHITGILENSIYKGPGRVATFAFVDPCGIKGLRIADVQLVLKQEYGEVLLFFNSDGVNRIVGGIIAGTAPPKTLIDSFGSPEAVALLIEDIKRAISSEDRESIIRNGFISALRLRTGVKYFVPFRFEAKEMDRVSHYLVHCSNHCLAFRLMKGVMETVGRDHDEHYGKMEFQNDRERGKQFELFNPDVLNRKDKILSRLKSSHAKVSEFSSTWVCGPEDSFSEAAYKRMIRELEIDGKIMIYDKSNLIPKPVSKRRPNTLGDDLWIRLA